MKMKGNLNDILFGIFFAFHLCTRTWPYGGVFQTFVDFVVGFTALLLFLHFMLRLFGSAGLRGKVWRENTTYAKDVKSRRNKTDEKNSGRRNFSYCID